MRRVLLAWVLMLVGFACLARGQEPVIHLLLFSSPPAGCAQATTYLGRVSGLSAAESSGMTTTICNMVAHGTYSKLDIWYQFAINNTTNALINVPNGTYSGTAHNAPTFMADAGYTGNGSNTWIDSGFNPSTAGGNFTQNCATIGYYGLTSRTTGTGVPVGGNDGAHYAYMSMFDAGPNIGSSLNDGSFGGVASGGANANGAWAAFRDSSSTTITVHHNGSSAVTITSTSTGMPNSTLAALGNNNNGTIGSVGTDQIAAIFAGCLTTSQVDNVLNDINGGIMKKLNQNVY